MKNRTIEITVQKSDVADVEADVLLLKYARRLHGADEMIAFRLAKAGIRSEDQIEPEVNEPMFVESGGVIAASQILFFGTQGLRRFRYKQMRSFACKSLEAIGKTLPQARVMATTVHGAGYGLDIEESLHALLFGFQQAINRCVAPGMEKIVVVERDSRRFEIIQSALKEIGPLIKPSSGDTPPIKRSTADEDEYTTSSLDIKPVVFVAMPFAQEFEDVYQFGIYGVVRRCGFVCERVDESYYAGNIVDRIQDGIRNSEFVIADLTMERPNVYLEVGFAWGVKKPVILVARDGQKLHFDLAHHKCIFYPTIGKLADELERTIQDLFVKRE